MEMDSCFGTTTLCVYVGSYVRRKSQAQKAQVKKEDFTMSQLPRVKATLTPLNAKGWKSRRYAGYVYAE